ncbi:TIGR03016 family PEP-CTERM system-associated outer membrane protein [Thalassotalea psychrophila]|uniref:TIGR03016 family PEP-CTERM system-associated outer membrane protein n=1 Tax=Thalassotalea psychrophila TaxID=3065647 RepID=A0ABY9TUW5_9GAMM|nr:TIGR03016 family PEP-CTERM system-associated outer membrane protein [Colwelliaceae bacterium SQ149]
MATTVTDMVKEQLNKSCFFIVCTLFILPSYASDWRVQSRLDFKEIFTDNVELVPGNADNSFVSLLSPGINVQYQSGKANWELDYTFTQTLYTHDHDLDDNYNTLTSSGSMSLWPDGLAFNFSASISNVSQNTARNSLADLVSADTVEYKNYQAGFSYLTESSSFKIDAEISFIIDEAEDEVGDRDGYNAFIKSESGSNSRYVFWNLDSQYTDYENNKRKGRFYTVDATMGYITNWKLNPFIRLYEEDTSGNLRDSKIQGTSSIGAGIRWLASEHLILDVAYNSVDDKSDAVGKVSDEQDDYVSGSINWQPSARTSFFAKYYQRFFGDAYQFNYSHRTKRLTTTLSYSETLDLFDRQELVPVNVQDVWCITGAAVEIGNCIFSPNENIDLTNFTFAGFYSDLELQESNSFNLNQTFNFTSTLALSRMTYQLSLRKTKRENLEIEDYDTYDFASFSITRLMSRTSELNLRFSFNKNSLDQNNPFTFEQLDYYRVYNINWQKQLNRTLSVTFSTQHLNRNSNRFGYSYKENRASMQVIKEF